MAHLFLLSLSYFSPSSFFLFCLSSSWLVKNSLIKAFLLCIEFFTAFRSVSITPTPQKWKSRDLTILDSSVIYGFLCVVCDCRCDCPLVLRSGITCIWDGGVLFLRCPLSCALPFLSILFVFQRPHPYLVHELGSSVSLWIISHSPPYSSVFQSVPFAACLHISQPCLHISNTDMLYSGVSC